MALIGAAVLTATPSTAAVWVDGSIDVADDGLVALPSPLPSSTIDTDQPVTSDRAIQALALLATALLVAQRMRSRGTARP